MKDNATSAVKVTYYSACLGNGPPTATTKCDGLKVGDVVSFTAEIVVTSCPQNPRDWFQTFQIYPVGINESLIVDLEMLCSCPCEQPGHPAFERNSKRCKGHGNYKCGVCECDASHFGRNCECSSWVFFTIQFNWCWRENMTLMTIFCFCLYLIQNRSARCQRTRPGLSCDQRNPNRLQWPRSMRVRRMRMW